MIREAEWLEPSILFNVEAALYKRSLHEFLQGAWHIVEGGREFQDNWHIAAICEHLEAVAKGSIRNLIINIPPRHSKSMLTSVMFPAWVWTHNPATQFLTASHAMSLSLRDAVKSRTVINSPWYQRYFADTFTLSGDQNQKGRYQNDKTGVRIATSVNSSTIGEGGDILILDDPHDPSDIHSDTQRTKDLQWIREIWLQRKNDPKTSRTILIMQRLHENDATGDMLASYADNVEHLMLPTQFDPSRRCVTNIGFADPRQKYQELLWGQRFGEAEVATIRKDLRAYGFAAQQQQQPAPDEGGILKKHYWRYWCYPGQTLPAVVLRVDDENIEIPCEPLPAEFDNTIMAWDMAFKGNADNDFVAGVLINALDADRYVTKLINERMDINGTLEQVKAWAAEYPDIAKYVEDAANGPAVVDLLRREIQGLLLVKTSEIGGSKIGRVNAIAPAVESGNIYLPHPQIAVWTNELILQAARFPNDKHDDMVDALTLGLIKMSGRRKRRKTRIREVSL